MDSKLAKRIAEHKEWQKWANKNKFKRSRYTFESWPIPIPSLSQMQKLIMETFGFNDEFLFCYKHSGCNPNGYVLSVAGNNKHNVFEADTPETAAWAALEWILEGE